MSVIAALECRGQFPGGVFVAGAGTVDENGGGDELGVKLSGIGRGRGTTYQEHCARARRAAGAVGGRKRKKQAAVEAQSIEPNVEWGGGSGIDVDRVTIGQQSLGARAVIHSYVRIICKIDGGTLREILFNFVGKNRSRRAYESREYGSVIAGSCADVENCLAFGWIQSRETNRVK